MTIVEEVNELVKLAETQRQQIVDLTVENNRLKKAVEELRELAKCIIPNQVYTHKLRRNTTVKFLDGSQQTVTRRKGEPDCIETAIAYCVLKQLLPSKDLKKLIENREEH